MGISVEGQKCPVCGAYIFDNDDLVFCPECGAPHHRDCYQALGHCAYKDKHGTPEGYTPPPAKTDVKQENPESHKKKPPFAQSERRCRFCGESLSEGENVCHKCGRPQAVNGQQPFGPNIVMDPLGGVLPDEMIDDVPAKEIKNYVAVNTQRYLPRFKMMNNKKKKSWNWAAFLVPHVWFFYRKMYLPGTLFTLLIIAASLFTLPFSAVVNTFPEEATASTAMLMNYFTENLSSINSLPLYLAIFGMVAEIIIRIVAGFMGDKLYRKAAIEGVKKVKSEDSDTDPELSLETALARKGGVNPLLAIICLFALDIVLEWIGAIYIML